MMSPPYITNFILIIVHQLPNPFKKIILDAIVYKRKTHLLQSEAIKPIIYYLDNGTPEPIRSALLKVQVGGIKRLNQQVLLMLFRSKLPEDADPMDLRFNMINWAPRKRLEFWLCRC
jgi:hypothetical protein